MKWVLKVPSCSVKLQPEDNYGTEFWKILILNLDVEGNKRVLRAEKKTYQDGYGIGESSSHSATDHQ